MEVAVGLRGSLFSLFRILDPRRLLLSIEVGKQRKLPRSEDAMGWYRASFTHRGDYVVYTDENGSTLVEVGIEYPCVVSASSVKRWNELSPISEAQRNLVLQRVVALFRKQGHECKIVE
jgi:hypothetical protein